MSSLAAIRPRALLRCADTCGSRFQGIGDDDAGVWRRSSWALTSGDGFGCTHAGGVVAAQSGFPVSETASHETRRTFLSSFGLAARVGVLQRLTRVGSSGAIRGKSSGQALNWGGLRLVLWCYAQPQDGVPGQLWTGRGQALGRQMRSGKESARCATRVKLNGYAQLRVGLLLSQWYEASEGAYGKWRAEDVG